MYVSSSIKNHNNVSSYFSLNFRNNLSYNPAHNFWRYAGIWIPASQHARVKGTASEGTLKCITAGSCIPYSHFGESSSHPILERYATIFVLC